MLQEILNLIPFIFYQVLYMTIVGSIIGLVIYVIRNIFDSKISGKWKCIMWSFVIIIFLIPIRFEIDINVSNDKLINQIETISDANVINKIENVKYISESANRNSDLSENNKNTINLQEIDTKNINSSSIATNLKNIVLNKIIPCFWLLGTITFGLIFLLGNRKIKTKISKSIYQNNRIEKILSECKEQLNIKKKIKLIIQEYKRIPSIFGILNPSILITEDILQENDETIKYIFLHELSHYKRKDMMLNYILLFALSIHWFNPIMWFLFNKIRQDIEIGTDELATKKLDKTETKQYGMALIKLLENNIKENYTASLLCVSDTEKNMERRIHMIKEKNKSKILGIVIAVIIIIIVACVVFIKFQNEEAFSKMKLLEGTASFGLKQENEQVEISSGEKQKIEEYINKICFPAVSFKIAEFNNINEASKEWIYSHVDSTNPYVSEEYIINNLQQLFGKDLIIDVKNDIASSDDIAMPTYDETLKKYVLPTYGMDNITGYTINSIEKINGIEYNINVIEYNAMADLFESDNFHELIISAYDETIEKTWKWKEVFRVNQDTTEDEIAKEVLKRKEEFESYNITIEKNNENYIVKKINKIEKTNNNSVSQIEESSNKIAFPLNSKYEISYEFGKTENGGIHTGIDFKADLGSDILALKGGEIIYSGYKGSYGRLVIIDHGDGMQTYYAHCSELLKEQGEKVEAGDVIAKVGSTGNSTGPQLHLEVRVNGTAVDPKSYLL